MGVREIKLDKLVKEIESDNEVLHIGSGTGFIFIGTRKEYDQQIDGVSKHYYDFYRSIPHAREKSILNTAIEIAKLKRDHKYKSELIKKVNKITTLYNSEIAAEDYIKIFKPLRNRKVLEVYPRIQKDGICIIVEGIEQGRYWDKSEWDKEHYGGCNV